MFDSGVAYSKDFKIQQNCDGCCRCGCVSRQYQCQQPVINEFTYCYLKRICRKILRDLVREERREKYSIFDGGNSLNFGQHPELAGPGGPSGPIGPSAMRAYQAMGPYGAPRMAVPHDAVLDRIKDGQVGQSKFGVGKRSGSNDVDPKGKRKFSYEDMPGMGKKNLAKRGLKEGIESDQPVAKPKRGAKGPIDDDHDQPVAKSRRGKNREIDEVNGQRSPKRGLKEGIEGDQPVGKPKRGQKGRIDDDHDEPVSKSRRGMNREMDEDNGKQSPKRKGKVEDVERAQSEPLGKGRSKRRSAESDHEMRTVEKKRGKGRGADLEALEQQKPKKKGKDRADPDLDDVPAERGRKGSKKGIDNVNVMTATSKRRGKGMDAEIEGMEQQKLGRLAKGKGEVENKNPLSGNVKRGVKESDASGPGSRKGGKPVHGEMEGSGARKAKGKPDEDTYDNIQPGRHPRAINRSSQTHGLPKSLKHGSASPRGSKVVNYLDSRRKPRSDGHLLGGGLRHSVTTGRPQTKESRLGRMDSIRLSRSHEMRKRQFRPSRADQALPCDVLRLAMEMKDCLQAQRNILHSMQQPGDPCQPCRPCRPCNPCSPQVCNPCNDQYCCIVPGIPNVPC